MGTRYPITTNWLLADLMDDEVKKLEQFVSEVIVRTNSLLIEGGKANDSLWIVGEGKLAVRVKGANGEPLTVAELGDGELVGEMSWLDGQPASATTVAVIESRMLRIKFSDFDKFLWAHPDAHIQILRKFAINLSHRLRGK